MSDSKLPPLPNLTPEQIEEAIKKVKWPEREPDYRSMEGCNCCYCQSKRTEKVDKP